MTNDCNTLDISKMIKIPLKSPNDQNTLVKMQKITKTPPKLPNYSKYLEIFKMIKILQKPSKYSQKIEAPSIPLVRKHVSINGMILLCNPLAVSSLGRICEDSNCICSVVGCLGRMVKSFQLRGKKKMKLGLANVGPEAILNLCYA